MGQHRIFYLAKFFEREEHLTNFIDWKLYANTLSFFKKLEEKNEPNRGDKNEGVITWGQPSQVQVEINGYNMSYDIAGPVSLSSNRLRSFNVICLYASYTECLGAEQFHDISKIREQLLISEECKQFGPHAVVIKNGPEFLGRVQKAARLNGLREAHGLVQYYDPDIFSGHFSGISGAFMKQKKFSFQREYRIVLESGKIGMDAITLNIGSIRDMVFCTTVREIHRNMKVEIR